jgi:hypothetical protein
MKQFKASLISGDILSNDLSRVSILLDHEEKQHVDNLLWSDNDYMPEVSFSMAYTTSSILLKYTVKEQHIKAVYRQINDPVYKDSCVEFFIAFNGEKNYYNLEFNCLGTALVGYGPGKEGRIAIDKQLIKKIKSHHLIKTSGTESNGAIEWELTLNIPFTVFSHHHITALNNQECAVNFYKCGDDLPKPHFLSWNNITHPQPNFHLPQFFGKVKFAS